MIKDDNLLSLYFIICFFFMLFVNKFWKYVLVEVRIF